MGTETGILWCDHTWNPVRGCAKVSEGCENCYAEVLSRRNPEVLGHWGPGRYRAVAAEAYWGEPVKWAAKWRKKGGRRGRVFMASLADFLEDHPLWTEPRKRALQAIWDARHWLEFLIVTKRPENGPKLLGESGIAKLKASGARFLVSVELQKHMERFVKLHSWWDGPNGISAEPLLGPVNLLEGYRLDWLITGFESQRGARPGHPLWELSLRRQAAQKGAAYIFKQWGEWSPYKPDDFTDPTGHKTAFVSAVRAAQLHEAVMYRVGAQQSGNLVDGISYVDFPEDKARPIPGA